MMRRRPNAQVDAWLELQQEVHLYISVLTLGELRKGIERLPGGMKKARLQSWVDQDLLDRFAGRVLPVDNEVAEYWGCLCAKTEKAGRTTPVVDGLIAATALVHGLTLVTRNIGDFEATGVPTWNPWIDSDR